MIIQANSEQLITFVLVDIDGVEVTGLGSTFTLEISKNGGAFAAGSGTKAEIGDGWYSYILTNNETNIPGPLSIRILGAGTVQQNLLHTIHPSSSWEPGEGPNILTVTEAATVSRCAEDDPNMLMLLPGIDAYIGMGTGWDWAQDDPVNEMAKNAARMLLVMWHENPAMTANQITGTLGPGFNAVMLQLKVLAMELLEEAGSA